VLVSIDLGYGYTKAISERGRVIFPSVIAPASDAGLDFGRTYRHVLEFRLPSEMRRRRFFVGEAALKEGRAAQLTLSRDRFHQESSVCLALAAAYLVGAERQTDLAVGLPLAYYRSRKEEAARLLRSVNAYVSVDSGPEKYISFNAVTVYPQAVGVLYALESLPERGLLGVIDIGFHTTDYILMECFPEGVAPLQSYTSSAEIGVATALKVFAGEFAERTGVPLSLADAHGIWVGGKREVTFRGRPLDIGVMIDRARMQVGQALAQAVTAAWSEKADTLDQVLLAGGGQRSSGQSLPACSPGRRSSPSRSGPTPSGSTGWLAGASLKSRKG
jgi:plasmid segregation protein ParM